MNLLGFIDPTLSNPLALPVGQIFKNIQDIQI